MLRVEVFSLASLRSLATSLGVQARCPTARPCFLLACSMLLVGVLGQLSKPETGGNGKEFLHICLHSSRHQAVRLKQSLPAPAPGVGAPQATVPRRSRGCAPLERPRKAPRAPPASRRTRPAPAPG